MKLYLSVPLVLAASLFRPPRLSPSLGSRLRNRMFNNGKYIGRNKFWVLVLRAMEPFALLTSSTN